MYFTSYYQFSKQNPTNFVFVHLSIATSVSRLITKCLVTLRASALLCVVLVDKLRACYRCKFDFELTA